MKLHGLAPAKHLGLEEPDHDALGDRFSHRFVGLALEAYGREVISRGKLMELTALVGIATKKPNR